MDHIDRCECGHDGLDHVRVVHSMFPCLRVGCDCGDYAEVIPDAETAADILTLLAT